MGSVTSSMSREQHAACRDVGHLEECHKVHMNRVSDAPVVPFTYIETE